MRPITGSAFRRARPGGRCLPHEQVFGPVARCRPARPLDIAPLRTSSGGRPRCACARAGCRWPRGRLSQPRDRSHRTGSDRADVCSRSSRDAHHRPLDSRGAVGEEQVGQIIDGLRDQGWLAIHDATSGRGNIDHILIGPAGLFTVETKSHRGQIDPGKIDPAMLKQAYAEGKFVERIVGTDVEPLLVFSRAFLIGRGVSRRAGVTVLPARMLAGAPSPTPASLYRRPRGRSTRAFGRRSRRAIDRATPTPRGSTELALNHPRDAATPVPCRPDPDVWSPPAQVPMRQSSGGRAHDTLCATATREFDSAGSAATSRWPCVENRWVAGEHGSIKTTTGCLHAPRTTPQPCRFCRSRNKLMPD